MLDGYQEIPSMVVESLAKFFMHMCVHIYIYILVPHRCRTGQIYFRIGVLELLYFFWGDWDYRSYLLPVLSRATGSFMCRRMTWESAQTGTCPVFPAALRAGSGSLKVEALDFNSQNTHVFKGSSEYVIVLFLERFFLCFTTPHGCLFQCRIYHLSPL